MAEAERAAQDGIARRLDMVRTDFSQDHVRRDPDAELTDNVTNNVIKDEHGHVGDVPEQV